jgi:hypothetical protein
VKKDAARQDKTAHRGQVERPTRTKRVNGDAEQKRHRKKENVKSRWKDDKAFKWRSQRAEKLLPKYVHPSASGKGG